MESTRCVGVQQSRGSAIALRISTCGWAEGYVGYHVPQPTLPLLAVSSLPWGTWPQTACNISPATTCSVRIYACASAPPPCSRLYAHHWVYPQTPKEMVVPRENDVSPPQRQRHRHLSFLGGRRVPQGFAFHRLPHRISPPFPHPTHTHTFPQCATIRPRSTCY